MAGTDFAREYSELFLRLVVFIRELYDSSMLIWGGVDGAACGGVNFSQQLAVA